MTTDMGTLVTITAMLGIVVIFYGPWQGLCVDFGRQIVFEQREKLFDMAADGRIAFEAPEYRKIRRSLEALIRFAHDVTIWKMIYLSILDKQEGGSEFDLLDVIREIKDADLNKEIFDLVMDASGAVALMMVARSALSVVAILIMPIVLLLALFFIGWKAILKQWRQALRYIGRAIQAEAEVFSASF